MLFQLEENADLVYIFDVLFYRVVLTDVFLFQNELRDKLTGQFSRKMILRMIKSMKNFRSIFFKN
jgi:hypothetical protein